MGLLQMRNKQIVDTTYKMETFDTSLNAVKDLLKQNQEGNIDNIRTIYQIKNFIEEFELPQRPNIPGFLLNELANWVRDTLDIGPHALGEQCSDLYHVYNMSVMTDIKIKRRSFTEALVYVLKVEFGAYYVAYNNKRPGSITHINLKKNKGGNNGKI